MHIHDVRCRLTQVLIGFGLLEEGCLVGLHMLQALIREECVSAPADRLADVRLI